MGRRDEGWGCEGFRRFKESFHRFARIRKPCMSFELFSFEYFVIIVRERERERVEGGDAGLAWKEAGGRVERTQKICVLGGCSQTTGDATDSPRASTTDMLGLDDLGRSHLPRAPR